MSCKYTGKGKEFSEVIVLCSRDGECRTAVLSQLTEIAGQKESNNSALLLYLRIQDVMLYFLDSERDILSQSVTRILLSGCKFFEKN